jgi:hypothetical protein
MAGKSSTVELLRPAVTQSIGVDYWLYRVKISRHHHSALAKLVRDYPGKGLGKLYTDIDAAGLTDEFADLLTRGIGANDRLVVIEGGMTPQQVDAITRKLSGRAVVWNVTQAPA